MYLNQIQIAESFGVSERVVEGWIRNQGLPHTTDGGRLLFDRAQVADWAAGRGLAAQAGFLAPGTPRLTTLWRLDTLLRRGGIWRDVAPADVVGVFRRVVSALPGATPPICRLLADRLAAPGGIAYAPVGGGLALPHPSARITLGHDSGAVAFLLLSAPLPLGEPVPDDVPVTRLVFFIAPTPRAHLELLGRLSRMLGTGPLRTMLVGGAGDDELHRAVASAEEAAHGPAGGAAHGTTRGETGGTTGGLAGGRGEA